MVGGGYPVIGLPVTLASYYPAYSHPASLGPPRACSAGRRVCARLAEVRASKALGSNLGIIMEKEHYSSLLSSFLWKKV